VRALGEAQVAWISDEVYAGFVYNAPALSPASLSTGGIVVSGLSKDSSMTGWRIGWVVGPPPIVARIIAVHQYLVTCASSISQAAALAAFGEAGRRERARMLERFRARRALMARELEAVPGIRFAMPDGAFYFFVDVAAHGDSRSVARRILDRCGVITIPGVAFGDNGEGWLRISYAAREEEIERGVRAIATELSRSPDRPPAPR
jgi:aspartate/methionine/tyrosine aminotransferase